MSIKAHMNLNINLNINLSVNLNLNLSKKKISLYSSLILNSLLQSIFIVLYNLALYI